MKSAIVASPAILTPKTGVDRKDHIFSIKERKPPKNIFIMLATPEPQWQ